MLTNNGLMKKSIYKYTNIYIGKVKQKVFISFLAAINVFDILIEYGALLQSNDRNNPDSIPKWDEYFYNILDGCCNVG